MDVSLDRRRFLTWFSTTGFAALLAPRVLAQDTAFLVTVPFYCPDTPVVEPNPVYLYLWDRFQKPSPFQADIVVAIDEVQRVASAARALADFALSCSGLASSRDHRCTTTILFWKVQKSGASAKQCAP